MYLRMPICPGQLGRRLQWFTKNWKVLTNDPWILNCVQAVHLELLSLPYQFQKPFAPNFSKLKMDLFSKEVDSLREEGDIEVATSEDKGQPRWLSGLRRSRVHSLWLLVDHCVLINWDRILVRAVMGLISRAGMVSICPLLWQRDVKLKQTNKQTNLRGQSVCGVPISKTKERKSEIQASFQVEKHPVSVQSLSFPAVIKTPDGHKTDETSGRSTHSPVFSQVEFCLWQTPTSCLHLHRMCPEFINSNTICVLRSLTPEVS